MEGDLEPVRQSYLHWLCMALGLKYSLLLPLAALLAFILTLIVVVRGKGPLAGAALVFIVPMPLFIGLYGAIEGVIAMYAVIANSTTQPKPSQLANGISMALATLWVGTLLMAPSYVVAMFGLFVRSLVGNSDRSPPSSDR
jgi:MotA/TolQ/ExbB proton channel family